MAFALKLLPLFLCPALALAQGTGASLKDPTQPPASFSATLTGESGLSATGAPGGGRLRSIIMPRRGGKPTALIDGQIVRLGGKLGDARLIRLTESEAVLEGPSGRETLYLTPDVTKKPVGTTMRLRQKEMP